MEVAFEKIAKDVTLLLDKDFMMNIFAPISQNVGDFKKHLDHIFGEKQSFAFGTCNDDEKWLPFDELRAQLFYPTSRYICQTHAHDIACQLLPLLLTLFWLSSVARQGNVRLAVKRRRRAQRCKGN